ncbi:hypothetical protein [Bacillus xiapuensis]|uniref:hypothetical protein n=1 Tax=Bacillus xiapuensis TaxID=2014075 RepID=UPI000C244E32|nr:hypothetical protein [Bacillus xiapuensis]
MKKFHCFLALAAAVAISGCNWTHDEKRPKEAAETVQQTADLTSGIGQVQTALQAAETAIERATNPPNKISTAGQQLEKKWDEIEKMIEESYPQDYKNIEKSLYPLINEMKKEQPDLQKLNALLAETKKKISAFKDKINPSV